MYKKFAPRSGRVDCFICCSMRLKNSLRSETARLQQTAKTAERRQLDDASGPSGTCMTNFWVCWAEAPLKIARMTLTIKLDGNWSSFQLANNTPPLSVTGSVIAPSARMLYQRRATTRATHSLGRECFSMLAASAGWRCGLLSIALFQTASSATSAFQLGGCVLFLVIYLDER